MTDPDTRKNIEKLSNEVQKLRLLLENALSEEANGDEIMNGYQKDLRSLKVTKDEQ